VHTVHLLFEERVKKTPNKIALVYENSTLTYQDLNTKANQLAHYIKRTYSIEPDTLVALCLERSEVIIIAILAVLKAGGAYVPIDPKYPQERIDYILQDTQSPFLLTDTWYQNIQDKLDQEESINPTTHTQDTYLAYMIYTSGTTGKPKGVMIEHKGLINHIRTMLSGIYNFTKGDKVASCMAYAFDASIQDFFPTLIGGGELHLLSEHVRNDVNEIKNYVINNKINHLQLPAALITLLPRQKYESLSGLIYGGAVCETNAAQYWSKHYNLYNCYGPTEASICTTFKRLTPEHETSIIGQAVENVHCHVLDKHLSHVSPGSVGELYIGGIGLARGYHNHPKLTAERFIPNPFQTEKEKQFNENARLYKTGDLVKLLPDGDIRYEGRADFQIKIRGFRIEPAEIESTLNTYVEQSSKITQSAVLLKERPNTNNISSKNQYLVAYYTSNTKLDHEKILAWLNHKLPDYMVPHLLIPIIEFPLTVSGKIDHKALPDPDFIRTNTQIIAPRNEKEKNVCHIWAEVLGIDKEHVGIKDDFFQLGGDSIIAIQIISHLRQKLNLTISVKDIFSYKTIASLFDHVLNKENHVSTKLPLKTEQGKLTGEVPLLPIQDWFFKKEYIKSNHWNQSFLIGVPELNIKQLQLSIQKLFSYHDSFRLKYKQNSADQIIQYYDENLDKIDFQVLDINKLDVQEHDSEFQSTLENIYTQWQADFNIETGPLARTAYIHGFSDGSARVYFALHHLIIDAVSWRILTRDLKKLYEQNDLGLKSSSYRQWCYAISKYPQSHKSEMEYWTSVISDFNPKILKNLAKNKTKINTAQVSLNAQDTQYLLTQCNKTYKTQINDLLLTALAYSVSACTNESINHIEVEGHGREDIDQTIDITQQVGWFTMMYPVRLEIKETLSETLISIKENLRRIPNKGIGFGALFGYHSELNPLITFNYLGQFSNTHHNSKKEWTLLSDSSGEAIHPENQLHSPISVVGTVFNGELKFTFSTELTEEKTRELAQELYRSLKDIIQLTMKEQRTYLTGHDVDYIVNQSYLDKIQYSQQVDGVYLANSLQQGFIYHALHQGNLDDAYRVQTVWEYKCKLNIDDFKKAWRYAQQKYPALRLRFAWNEQMVQIIDSQAHLNWSFIDLNTNQSILEQQNQLAKILKDDRDIKFDLSQSNLFRITLIKLKEDDYTCILTIHHIIADGWSGPRIFHFVHETYRKLIRHDKMLFSIDQSYTESQKYLQTQKNDLTYWNNLISQIEDRTDLSGLLKSDKRHIRINEYKQINEPKEQSLKISGKLYTNLKSFGKKYGVTLNAILQYAWHKILSLYGNSTQTVVGTTISGRHLPIDDIEDSVGLYINTLPLIFDHTKSKNIVESIRNIQESIQELNQRSADNLTYMQKDGVRLFDSMFVYDSYPLPAQSDDQDFLQSRCKGTFEKIDYPLGIVALENQNELYFKLNYASELFDQNILQNLSHTIERILSQIATDSISNIQDFQYLTPSQYKQVIKEIDLDSGIYSDKSTIQSLFEGQVQKTPNQTALVYEKKALTYHELNLKSNQLAHYLKKTYAIKPDDLIALCLNRSEVMIIAILAVLKAGGAYAPIDPKYPKERIDYILQDTQSPLLLTDEWYHNVYEKLKQEIDTNPITHTNSTHLVYIIYTSGTTGKPKGVMIEQKGLINHVCTLSPAIYDFTKGSKMATGLSYVFDASAQDIFCTLLAGGELHILNEQVRVDVEKIRTYVIDNKINYLQLPAALLALFPKQRYESLYAMIYGGAVCDTNTAEYWSKNYNLYNCYGPTEASVCTTFKKLNFGEDTHTIGKPVDRAQCYLLDSNLTPLPIGAVGELYIGGIGLARGYINHPKLTAKQFITNPFQTDEHKHIGKNSKLYKTGDLARLMPDGNLRYEGRVDFQVKIRGFRIELGEIETTLNHYKDETSHITQSVVLAKSHLDTNQSSSNNQYLVGYYTSNGKLNEEKILEWLHLKLPDYMIPNILVHIEKLPLTTSGKIDRRALPKAEFTYKSEQIIVPRNDVEKNIRKIWADVLEIESELIGINDNFFRLGGNSILAVKLMTKINDFYKSHINLSHLFLYKSIEQQTLKIFETRDQDQKIIRLNESSSGKNLFMIHPGTGGCEVYVSLAHQLSHLFNCYGVDSYNLYHEKKIDDLNFLAHYYLDLIDKVAKETHQTEFHLLGLCLGGKIALEIAGILEKRGETKIKVYLLDTVLVSGSTSNQGTTNEFREQMSSQGFDELYIEKIIAVIPTEQKLQRNILSYRLKKTKILLFKAMLPDPLFKSLHEEFCQRILPLEYNHVDKYIKNESQIKTIKMHGAYHRTVLKKEETLIEAIANFETNNLNFPIKPSRTTKKYPKVLH